jgi:hypothetical protein
MTVFDTKLTMFNVNDPNVRGVEETAGELDAELWSKGIAHAFILPDSVEPTEDGKQPALVLMYCQQDHLELSLILLRHNLKARGAQPVKIAEAMMEVAAKIIAQETA